MGCSIRVQLWINTLVIFGKCAKIVRAAGQSVICDAFFLNHECNISHLLHDISVRLFIFYMHLYFLHLT